MTGSDVGKRLARYLGDGPGKRKSIRAFAEEMKNREPRPPGSSRAMIHRYLAGTAPPADFIYAAADVLGLRRDWLAFGEGAPTAEEEAVASAAEASMAGPNPFDRLRAELPGLATVDMMVSVSLFSFLGKWAEAMETAGQPAPSEDERIAYARRIWEWAHQPFLEWAEATGAGEDMPVVMGGLSDALMLALQSRHVALYVSQTTHRYPTKED
jgi:hypothetical protein